MNKAVPIGLLIVIGLLSLCALPGATVSAQNFDPTVMGPLTVTSEDYYREDLKFMPPGFKKSVELSGIVHYPTNWLGGPLPLIIFMHGKHAICSQGGTPNQDHWPCNMGEDVITNFKGYDYMAKVLASYGYFVVSINANGIVPEDKNLKNLGPKARAELISHHLDLWNTLTTMGDDRMGMKFKGKIDMNRIGLMGHSRGSEGVIRYFKDQSSPPQYGIKAIFVIAPPDITIPAPPAPPPSTNAMGDDNQLNINNVPLAVLLPYCDGDVTNLAGVHYYDDSRYTMLEMNAHDRAPKHTILAMGANHNFFNMVWTGKEPCRLNDPNGPSACDDFTQPDSFCGPENGSGRLTDVEQRTIATAYVCAFMRAYVGGESQFLPLLTNQSPPPLSVGANKVHVSFQAPDNYLARLDINRLSEASNLMTNTLGGNVIKNNISFDFCGVAPNPRCLSVMEFTKEPHAVSSSQAGLGVRQLKLGWNNNPGSEPGSLINQIPIENRNISGYQALQFRASVNFDSMLNASPDPQNFSVVLKDGTGATASVSVARFSSALFFPPGSSTLLPKAVLNMVRLPLSAFKRINLMDIQSVEFRFDQQAKGALLITDIALVSTAHILVPVFSSDACLKDDSSGAELRFNTMTGNYVFCYGEGLTMSGVGKVVTHASTVTLTQGENELDRRIVVTMDRLAKRGTASLQAPGGSLICTITDRNTANNTCTCTPIP
jgi:hypothetical protein